MRTTLAPSDRTKEIGLAHVLPLPRQPHQPCVPRPTAWPTEAEEGLGTLRQPPGSGAQPMEIGLTADSADGHNMWDGYRRSGRCRGQRRRVAAFGVGVSRIRRRHWRRRFAGGPGDQAGGSESPESECAVGVSALLAAQATRRGCPTPDAVAHDPAPNLVASMGPGGTRGVMASGRWPSPDALRMRGRVRLRSDTRNVRTRVPWQVL